MNLELPNTQFLIPNSYSKAGVVKLVDISDLGSDAARHGGSSPSTRTIEYKSERPIGRDQIKRKGINFSLLTYQPYTWLQLQKSTSANYTRN
jgi:hypothetical protein